MSRPTYRTIDGIPELLVFRPRAYAILFRRSLLLILVFRRVNVSGAGATALTAVPASTGIYSFFPLSSLLLPLLWIKMFSFRPKYLFSLARMGNGSLGTCCNATAHYVLCIKGFSISGASAGGILWATFVE